MLLSENIRKWAIASIFYKVLNYQSLNSILLPLFSFALGCKNWVDYPPPLHWKSRSYGISVTPFSFIWENIGKTQLAWEQHDTPRNITFISLPSSKSPSVVPHQGRRNPVINPNRENNGETFLRKQASENALLISNGTDEWDTNGKEDSYTTTL